jgi:hypothetical protein
VKTPEPIVISEEDHERNMALLEKVLAEKRAEGWSEERIARGREILTRPAPDDFIVTIDPDDDR